MQGSIFVFIPPFWTLSTVPYSSEGIHVRFAVGLIFVYLELLRHLYRCRILGECHRKIRLIEGNVKCHLNKIDLQRDFAAGVDLSEAQNLIMYPSPPTQCTYTCILYIYAHREGGEMNQREA